ncbi:MAG: LPS-assembly protein LptD, partial [Cytophagales bacterium]|nr:LPS-assembly protein LptD [Cytophaga sp.]
MICCLLNAEKISAQIAIPDSLHIVSKKDSTKLDSDTLSTSFATITGDTSVNKSADTIDVSSKKEIETTILYSCRDSIRMNIAEQKVYLYGNAKVTYGDRILESEFMEINWATNEVKSYGGKDTVRGKTIGRPLFHEGSDMYSAEEIRYNMKSGKGIIKGIVTRQGDGYIQGGPVKKTPEAIYVKNAFYTTCNLPHPHYRINASKLKVIPGDKVVTGPFHMEIMGIPVPLGLPLGFFPVTRRSKSGVIIPTIGEQSTRGLFLSNGGYYWAVNDYVGIKLVGSVYANKSYLFSASANYVKKYGYRGDMMLNYSKVKNGFDDGTVAPQLYSVRWSHGTLGNKPSRFTADVNISSSKYYQQNSYNPIPYQSTNFASNVSWFKTFRNSPFSLSMSFRQNQNTTTRIMTVDAPDIALTMVRIYPFKSKGSDGAKWFEKINFSYAGTTRYSISNSLTNTSVGGAKAKDTIVSVNSGTFPLMLEQGKWGLKNTIPITTTFKLFKYFSLNPLFNYNQWVYADKLVYHDTIQNGRTTAVGVKTPGFNMAHSYDVNLTLTTRVYGMYRIKSNVLKAVRHTIIPAITYRYQPDASGNSNYFYKSDQIYSSNGQQTPFSVYQNSLYSGP